MGSLEALCTADAAVARRRCAQQRFHGKLANLRPLLPLLARQIFSLPDEQLQALEPATIKFCGSRAARGACADPTQPRGGAETVGRAMRGDGGSRYRASLHLGEQQLHRRLEEMERSMGRVQWERDRLAMENAQMQQTRQTSLTFCTSLIAPCTICFVFQRCSYITFSIFMTF